MSKVAIKFLNKHFLILVIGSLLATLDKAVIMTV